MKNSLLGIGIFLQAPMLLMGLFCLLSDGRDWTIYPWVAVYFLVSYLLVFLVTWTLIKEKEESRLFGVLVIILSLISAVFFWLAAYEMSFMVVPCYLGLLFLIFAGISILGNPSSKWSFEWLVELYHSKLFTVFLLFSLMLCFMMNIFYDRFERFMFALNPQEISMDACYVVDVQGVEGWAELFLDYKQPDTVFSTYCGKMSLVYEVNGEQVESEMLRRTLKDGDVLKISLKNTRNLPDLDVSSEPVEIDVKLYRKITSFNDLLMPFEEYVALILEQAQMEAGTIKEAYFLQNEMKDTLIAVHWITETRQNLWIVLKNPHEMKCSAVTCESVDFYYSLSDIEFACSAKITETWEGNQ